MTIKFTKSNKLRNKLISTQEEQFRKWFKKAYRIIQEKITSTGLYNSEGNLTGVEVQKLNSLSKFAVKTYTELVPKFEDEIRENMYVVSESVVREFEKKSKTDVRDDRSFIMGIVSAVALGRVYDTNWSLHKALVAYPREIQKLVEKIIKDGIDDHKSASEIVGEITDVLNPSSSEQERTYRGHGMIHTGRIDATVQKIAKTTLVHDYQRAVVEVAKEVRQPQVYIRWISALAPNTCELCAERHMHLFDVNDVPLEHPNGQCELEIEIL